MAQGPCSARAVSVRMTNALQRRARKLAKYHGKALASDTSLISPPSRSAVTQNRPFLARSDSVVCPSRYAAPSGRPASACLASTLRAPYSSGCLGMNPCSGAGANERRVPTFMVRACLLTRSMRLSSRAPESAPRCPCPPWRRKACVNRAKPVLPDCRSVRPCSTSKADAAQQQVKSADD